MKNRNYLTSGFNCINCANGIVLSFGIGCASALNISSRPNKISDSLTSVSVIAF